MVRFRVMALSVLLLCSALGAQQVPPPRLSVLFVGNSLTMQNDLPGMLESLLHEAGMEQVRVESVSRPGWGLEDHWRLGGARKKIKSGEWDVVVLQQGPSATEGRPSLLEYTGKFAERIDAAGGTTALYMVWPSRARSFDFDGVSESYTMAARSVGGLLFPVGDAWRVAWRRDADAPLYGPDGFHPSVPGTYLAALVMVQELTGRDVRGMPARLRLSGGDDVEFGDELATLLQDAAAESRQHVSGEPSPGPDDVEVDSR